MKKNMLILLALLFTFSSIFAMDVEIGTGTTTTSYVPLYGLYDYSWSDFIIDADLIGVQADFNQIQFNVSNVPASYATDNQKIYFKNTSETTVPGTYTNPETAGFTLVYDGPITWNGGGWQGVMLDSPITYNGTDNLRIIYINNDGSWGGGYPNFYTTEVTTNVCAHDHADGALPTAAGTVVTYYPNMILSYPAENEPTMATLVAPEDHAMNIETSPTLSWLYGDNTTEVDVFLSDNMSDVAGLVASAKVVDGQDVTSYSATGLANNTTYYWRVVSRNTANNLEVNGPIWRFTTEVGGGVVTVGIGDGAGSAYNYPWNFYYKNSIAETIYLASEINIGGVLTGITYYNTFSTDLTNKPVKIWIGETTQTDLSTYIPASQLTEVFDGNVNFPSGQNNINIEFDTPYAYSGGNLVILTERAMDTEYFSSDNKFYNTTGDLANRTLYWQDDYTDLDPNTLTGGTVLANYPNIALYVLVEGMGSVSGTVTDGTTGLGGVDIVIDDTNYHTVSATDGSFELPYVAEATDYNLTASLFGYYDGTATFDVVEDQTTTVNVTLATLPQVEVTGQIITNDTGLGIQAHVELTGYDTYATDTDANGYFTFTDVYASQTYNGVASAEGYQNGNFIAEVGDVDLDLGTIMVTENLYPARNVVAELAGNNVQVSWNTPGSGGGVESFSDAFEGDLSAWEEVIQGAGTPGETGNAYWYVGAPDLEYDGNCLRADWGYDINSWVITPAISVTSETAINFEMSTSYHWFVDPNDNGDLSIKVSTDGANWTEIWTEDDYGVFDNFAWLNISIPLSEYAGQGVQVAFNLIGNDNANIHVDNVFIGASRNTGNYVVSNSTPELSPTAKIAGVANINNTITNKAIVRNNNSTRAFESYNVYRFLLEDEENITNWDLVAEEITDTTYTDTQWSTLDSGFYKYAVRAVYTNSAEANPAFSNWLQKSSMADVTVNVESNLGEDIADANIELVAQVANPDGEFDTYNAVTDASGSAVINVVAGMYDISVNASGYTQYADVVDATADVTVNIVINELALPPTAIIAEQVDEDALITWSEPGGGGAGEWITKGAEENNDGIGTDSAAIIDIAQNYTAAELADYQGMYINAIKFFPREATATYTLKVWGGADGTTELYSQLVDSFTNEAWNEYTLDSSVAIPDGPVWIGYTADTPTGWPAGCDAGPAVTGGDLIRMGSDVWESMAVTYGLNYNWNIQAYVSWSRGGQVASNPRQLIFKSVDKEEKPVQLAISNRGPVANSVMNPERSLEGYKVWRLLSTDQGNENNWTLLTDNMITDMTYTDTDWNTLDPGSYKFAVKAIYTNDNLSPAAFSNILLKDMYGTVDGMVMNEAVEPINGATVTLDGNTITTDASGYFLFTDVLAGEYDITASAPGYVTSTQTITVVGTQLTTVDFELAESNILISDGFETYPDFSLEAGDWTLIDGDLSPTYGFQGIAFENSGSPMAYIVFNPAMTTPPLEEDANAPHSGSKYMACFASTTPSNNDWMITPEFTLGETGSFNFWGKTVMADYGLERFNVLVSEGSTNPNDFVSISGPSYTEAPITWTQYSYSLDAYANQTIRVAIQCVSSDAFIFMVDDVEIDAPNGTDINDNDIVAVSQLKGNYPNPFNPETTIAFSTKENGPVSLEIFNLKGQKVRTLVNEELTAGTHNIVWNGKDDNGKSVASGVFFYRMKSGKYTSTKKMILMK